MEVLQLGSTYDDDPLIDGSSKGNSGLGALQQSNTRANAWRGSLVDVVMDMAAGGKLTLGSEDWNAVAALGTGTY